MTDPTAGAEQRQSEIVPLQLIGSDTDAGRCADNSCLLPGDSVPNVTSERDGEVGGG